MSRSLRAIVSPRPSPSAGAPSRRVNSAKMRCVILGSDAGAGIAHDDLDDVVVFIRAELRLAAAVLDGVRDQVLQNGTKQGWV